MAKTENPFGFQKMVLQMSSLNYGFYTCGTKEFFTYAIIMEQGRNSKILLIFHYLMRSNTIARLVKVCCVAIKNDLAFGVINLMVNKVKQMMVLPEKTFHDQEA